MWSHLTGQQAGTSVLSSLSMLTPPNYFLESSLSPSPTYLAFLLANSALFINQYGKHIYRITSPITHMLISVDCMSIHRPKGPV